MDSFLGEKTTVTKQSKIYFCRQLFLFFSCHLQSICGGSVFGLSSILLPQLYESQEIVLNKNQESWIASIPTLMMFPTVLCAGPIMDKFGRRKSLFYVYILTAIAWLVMYSSTSYWWLFVARGLAGAYVGQAYPIILAYMGEIAHPGIRAAFLAGVPLGCASGVLMVQLLGIYLHWKTICLIILMMPIYNMCSAIYIKESYIWFINKGYDEEARRVFFWYRGKNPEAKAEFTAALENNSSIINSSFREKLRFCTSKKVLMPFMLTALLYLTCEFSGDTALIFYTSHIIKIITSDPEMQYYSTLTLNILRIVATGMSCVLLKKFSTRTVWIASGFALAFSLFNISLFLYLSDAYPENKEFPLICIVAVVVNVIFFALGVGPMPAVICGEIYPASVRDIGGAISAFTCFSSVFVVVKCMPYLFEYVDKSVIFLIFGLCTFTGVTITCFVLPNTKNKTLKELETFYES